MKLQARRAQTLVKTLGALAVAMALLAFPTPEVEVEASPELYAYPQVPVVEVAFNTATWSSANKFTGFGTTYDAYKHAWSWYDSSDTWVSVDPQNQSLNKKKCKAHPEWGCYYRDMGTWKKLVRPWDGLAYVGNLYAAIGPYLRQRISSQMPRWHQIPTHKLLITSLITHKSVEVWIVDYCDCRQNHPNGPASSWSAVDLSPQAWAALGAYRNGTSGPNIKGWKNTIEVRFLP
jgi:hypothetical protein